MASSGFHRWPCSECGAQLRFAPGQYELRCDHCGNLQQLPEAAPEENDAALTEHDLARGLADNLPGAEMELVRTSRCTSCGALIEFQGATHATECPFCATPVVTGTGETRQIKPQALVPFVCSERQAREQLVKWLGSLWFAPNKLLQYTRRGRAMNGVYVPYWTFDAETRSRYTGQRGDAYYETRTVVIDGKRQSRQERKIRWSHASGRVARDFDDVLVLGSLSLPERYANALEPWDLGALLPYSPDYLAGFTAEGYTVALADAEPRSKQLMAQVIAGDVRHDIGGDEQRISSVETDYRGETFKHILLPVWMAAYKYNGKSYRFLVNGQTGEVQGERPWSVWKITFATIALAIILAGVFYATK
ncbi:primosomal protein N' (replication factor Y) - superfamily II helicase [Pseudogemmobacter faecipullorum]|uniref:Primosomal protein N' (Replication factor Y) -superfamily II helicase n=1 Tax=Pseudogemmobacter faecipullorum TaxID=2755041 RepID=A0ABS8CLE5_9RHOB|nr:primosomal protein N' (replication factor Y) - superfamily II helicase [Pseudogemmobacter faecipullorum]MCB5410221.1 primosomal protein N' (replication factor Y) - superfamily II helicase [Pseudogemmobacter faecipullorum]